MTGDWAGAWQEVGRREGEREENSSTESKPLNGDRACPG